MNKSEELLSLLEAKKRIVQDVIEASRLMNYTYETYDIEHSINIGRCGIKRLNNQICTITKDIQIKDIKAGNTYLFTYKINRSQGSRIFDVRGVTDIGVGAKASDLDIKFNSVADFYKAYKFKSVADVQKEMVKRDQTIKSPLFSVALIKTNNMPLMFNSQGQLRMGDTVITDIQLVEEATVVPLDVKGITEALNKKIEALPVAESGRFDVELINTKLNPTSWCFVITSGTDYVARLDINDVVTVQSATTDIDHYKTKRGLWPYKPIHIKLKKHIDINPIIIKAIESLKV